MCEGCNKYCNLDYGHEGDCICKQPNFHKCNKRCILSDANGCNKDCTKIYGHLGNHFCSTEPEKRICKYNCQLCEKEVGCGRVYNHEKFNNLKCSKCEGKICKLSYKGHLCGSYHQCKKECEEGGCCEIKSFVEKEEQNDSQYTTNLREIINYKSIKSQKTARKKCMVKIPPNEFSHIGKNHTYKYFKHFCGFQCKQCNYYCDKLYGHKNLHKCFHGNIRHSSIFINDYTNKNSVANINKDNQSYKLTEGESVKIFVCDNYCKQQGQGHIHFFESEEEINSKDVK